MGNIVISTNTSLDGVVQDPDGQEGFRLGGWFGRSGRPDLEEWARIEADEAMRAEALLLGRRSDEWFARRWMSREGPWADRLNRMPRYVVSSTVRKPAWGLRAGPRRRRGGGGRDGERLFGPTSQEKPMRLASARTLGTGLAVLAYRRAAPGE